MSFSEGHEVGRLANFVSTCVHGVVVCSVHKIEDFIPPKPVGERFVGIDGAKLRQKPRRIWVKIFNTILTLRVKK